MGLLQPNSSFVNFCDVWSQFRQLLLSAGELWPLGPCKRRGSRGEGGSAGCGAGGGQRLTSPVSESRLCRSLAV